MTLAYWKRSNPNFTVREQVAGNGGGPVANKPTVAIGTDDVKSPRVKKLKTGIGAAGAGDCPVDIDSTWPTVNPVAVATFCACVRASARRSGIEHCCDCRN